MIFIATVIQMGSFRDLFIMSLAPLVSFGLSEILLQIVKFKEQKTHKFRNRTSQLGISCVCESFLEPKKHEIRYHI